MRIEPGTSAVVTGASRGIGRALCAELASKGARLGLMARGREGLEELAAELPESPDGAHVTLAADVTKWGQARRALDRFAKRAGGSPRRSILRSNARRFVTEPIRPK